MEEVLGTFTRLSKNIQLNFNKEKEIYEALASKPEIGGVNVMNAFKDLRGKVEEFLGYRHGDTRRDKLVLQLLSKFKQNQRNWEPTFMAGLMCMEIFMVNAEFLNVQEILQDICFLVQVVKEIDST